MSDEELRAAAVEILAENRFARWNSDFEAWLQALEGLTNLIPNGLIEAMSWLWDFVVDGIVLPILGALGQFLSLFGVFGRSPDAIGWVAVLLLLSIGLVFAYRLWGERWLGGKAGGGESVPGRSHADSIAEARAIAGEGRFLEAAHRVQLATLSMLIEFDWLELSRSDPNRTLRKRIADSSLPAPERSKMIQLIDRLERLWFDEPLEDPDLFEDWIALDTRLARLAVGASI